MRRVAQVAAVVLTAVVLSGCTPVQGPEHVFSVMADPSGKVIVVVSKCPDGWGGAEEIALRHERYGSPLWTVRSERGPYSGKFVLGVAPPGYEASGKLADLDPGREYVVGEWSNVVGFRLADLRTDRLWDGERYIEESDQQAKCAELLAAAERRSSRMTAFLLVLPVATVALLVGIVVAAVVHGDRLRSHEARVLSAGASPNPNWPIR